MRPFIVTLAGLLLMGIALAPGHPLAAQGDDDACPALVATALEAVGDNCADLARNQACYGHAQVRAAFWQPRVDLRFRQPADRVPLLDLRSISTAPLDPLAGTWGLATLHAQANLPQTLPGQAVTFLLMGDATLENAVPPGEVGPGRAPMQAVYFTTGLGAPACHQAPNALVVQSPTGVEVTLRINDLDVLLGSTAVFALLEVAGERGPTPVMVAVLLHGRLRATVSGFPLDLEQPRSAQAEAFPVLAVTLNPQGRVDSDSRLLAPPVDALAALAAPACRNAALAGLLGLADLGCDAPPRPYMLPPVAPPDEAPALPASPGQPADEEITTISPYWNVVLGHRCGVSSGSTTVVFTTGSGCYASPEEAAAATALIQTTVTIDGEQAVPINIPLGVSRQEETTGCGPDFNAAEAWHVGWRSGPVRLSPGTHELFIQESSAIRPTMSMTCTYTAR